VFERHSRDLKAFEKVSQPPIKGILMVSSHRKVRKTPITGRSGAMRDFDLLQDTPSWFSITSK